MGSDGERLVAVLDGNGGLPLSTVVGVASGGGGECNIGLIQVFCDVDVDGLGCGGEIFIIFGKGNGNGGRTCTNSLYFTAFNLDNRLVA